MFSYDLACIYVTEIIILAFFPQILSFLPVFNNALDGSQPRFSPFCSLLDAGQ